MFIVTDDDLLTISYNLDDCRNFDEENYYGQSLVICTTAAIAAAAEKRVGHAGETSCGFEKPPGGLHKIQLQLGSPSIRF